MNGRKKLNLIRLKLREIDKLVQDVRQDLEADNDRVFHNTMRFDISLAYIQPMIDMEMVDKDELADAIRIGILDAIKRVACDDNDIVDCVKNAIYFKEAKTEMLHRETICIDFS